MITINAAFPSFCKESESLHNTCCRINFQDENVMKLIRSDNETIELSMVLVSCNLNTMCYDEVEKRNNFLKPLDLLTLLKAVELKIFV